MTELLLIDLSSVFYPIWHISGSEPDPDHASNAAVARVRALASEDPHVAICCDSGKSFRAEIEPSYKAQRQEAPEALKHQLRRAQEMLRGDGFPVWAIKGFEADDLIASAAWIAEAEKEAHTEALPVVIVSSDKDLLALVGPGVSAKSLRDGSIIDEAGVVEKFGVRPAQMTDYLSLVGDTADNIKGAKGIGPKKAAELLKTFPDLDALYACVDDGTAKFTPALTEALLEFRPRLETVRSLVRLRTDAPIPFEEIFAERKPKDVEPAFDMEGEAMGETTVQPGEDREEEKPAAAPEPEMGLTLIEPGRVNVVPAEWERQLDPRDMSQAWKLAQSTHAARLFNGYGNASACLAAIMTGRELGLPAMASLRCIHVIEGKMALSAALMVALILKSGLADYFRPVNFDAKQATFETLRKGEGNKPVALTHTIEMAITAGLVKEKSNWAKVPIDMLCARAQSRLARMIYPDLLAGLYTPEELEEIG